MLLHIIGLSSQRILYAYTPPHIHTHTHKHDIYVIITYTTYVYGIYNIKPSAAAPMTLLDECNWNAAILRTARDVLCSVGWGRYGNGNRIFFERKTRFVRFRQCGFFFLQPTANFTPVSFGTIFFLVFSISYHYIIYLFISFLIFVLLLLIYYFYYYYFSMLKGFGNLPTAYDIGGGSRVSRPTSWVLYNTLA